MNLVLVGYMGSGKSTIGLKLSKILEYNFIDLDHYIVDNEQLTVQEIFKTKGEIYFRKLEQKYLKQIISKHEKTIIALGGGTPCFYDTMDFLNLIYEIKTIYLKTNLDILTNRLFKDTSRPLISHLKTKVDLKEFIAKHLFERSFFYNKAKIVVEANEIDKTIDSILFTLNKQSNF